MNDLLVLCYHAVSPTWRVPYAVTPERLVAQVTSLTARGYQPATLSRAMQPQAGRTLVVTFDDALASVRDHALPALERLGVPATLFACSAWVGRDEPMRIGYDEGGGAELVSLGWDDLAVLRDAGWEIGSHTRTHPRLTELAPAELTAELAGSRREIEEALGGECVSLAYPHGAADDAVAAAARAAGYRFACTGQAGVRAGDPLRIPRVLVLGGDGPARMRVKTSPAARRLRSSPALWRVLAPLYTRTGGGHRDPA